MEEYRNKKHQYEEVVKDIEVTREEFTRLQNLYWVFETHNVTVTVRMILQYLEKYMNYIKYFHYVFNTTKYE